MGEFQMNDHKLSQELQDDVKNKIFDIPYAETMRAEVVELPGAGEQANIIPENFEAALMRDIEKLYQKLLCG